MSNPTSIPADRPDSVRLDTPGRHLSMLDGDDPSPTPSGLTELELSSEPAFFERWMERFYLILDRAVAVMLFALLVEVCAIILTRQLGLSWVWLYDIARWTLAWLVFYGAVSLTGRGDHLTVEVAAEALPYRARWAGRALSAVAAFGVAVLIMYYGGLEVIRMYQSGERSMSGRLPAFIGYSVLPIAFALLAVASIDYLLKAGRRILRPQ